MSVKQDPAGWQRQTIGELLTICHGRSQKDVLVASGTIPILATGGQIGWANQFIYNEPSVLIGRKGTIDRPQYIETPFWTVDTLFYSKVTRPNDAKFLFYVFDSIQWRNYNEASGVPSLNARTIERIEVLVPTPEEQLAIAQTLSDVDALIEALSSTLAKKRDIKQATMQQLLTGKTRLPGFEGEWSATSIGALAVCFSGGTPSTSSPQFYGGEIPWITSSDLNQKMIYAVDGRINAIGLKNSSAKMVGAGTPLVALYGATAGVTAITKIDGAINQAVLAIVPGIDSAEFIYFNLTRLKHQILSTFCQGGQPNLSGSIIKSIEFLFPPLPEQKAIAQTLTDLDAELSALEARIEKTRALKGGMMQELLTGRIRLL